MQEALTFLTGNGYPPEISAKLAAFYTPGRLEKQLSGVHTIALGAYQDQLLIGAVWGFLWEDGVLSIEWCVVNKDVMGTGVFTRLMQGIEAEGRAHGAHKLFLYTSPTNIGAIARYKKLGFIEEGIHPRHFFDWDAVSMGKVVETA